MRTLNVTFVASFVLFVVAIGALGVTIVQRSHDPTARSALPLSIALSCGLAAILVVTLVPTPGVNEHQLIPVVEIISGLRSSTEEDALLNVVANGLLLLSLGAALCLRGFSLRTTTLIAFGLSALVEVAQLFISGRTSSVDDVLLNTLGAVLGHVAMSPWAPVAQPSANA